MAKQTSTLRYEPSVQGYVNGARKPNGKPRSAAEKKVPDIVEVACRFAAARRRPAAIYLLAEGDLSEDRPDMPITRRTVDQLANALQDDRFRDLDLVIQSSGGDIHAAYQMMLLLRGRMTRKGGLVACVPGKAQSSATLLCLGADKILLGELGTLSPLDAQIRSGVTDIGTPDYTSALHLLKGLNRLQQFSLDAFEETAARLYDHHVCRGDDLLKYSIAFTQAIMSPLFERIESHRVGYWDQMLQTGEYYGCELLNRGSLIKNVRGLDREEHIRRVLHRLVYYYRSHESVIDCDELARELDLRAKLMPIELRPIVRDFASCASETLIMVVYPPGLETPFETVLPEMTLAEWKSLSGRSDAGARATSWASDAGVFSMRVGLYRPKIMPGRNPWRESVRRITDSGPAAQYLAGPVALDEPLARAVSLHERFAAAGAAEDGGQKVGRRKAAKKGAPNATGDGLPGHAGQTARRQVPDVPSHIAYPRIDCDDVVVMDVPFDVEIGLSRRRDRDLISTGALSLPNEVNVDLLLTYDPESLRIEGPQICSLRVTDEDPYPSTTVRVTALDGDDLARERRLGVYFIVEGAVVGFAWRIIAAVGDRDDIPNTPRPDLRERELLDLGSVAKEESPDLILAVYRADDVSTRRFTWAAYPTSADVAVPDVERSYCLGNSAAQFATNTRRYVAQDREPASTFDWLHGIGKEIGRCIPDGITKVIRKVAEMPGRAEPATVLLFTEEVHVPWELAAFKPLLATSFGGASPFLGAHVTIGRWLLTERKPRPTPPRRVDVHSQALFTAKYEGVTRWPTLPAAEQEAADLAQKYPPSTIVQPLYDDVMQCLRGEPQADVMHFALHGQFDPDGIDEGLVLLTPKPGGGFTAQYLQPPHVDAVDFGHAPFVFLNACQMGATKKVLGDYAGMAAAFLHAGAAGVIAPLWNVDDHLASTLARDFYDAAYSADAPSVAEVLRRARAKYTRKTATAAAADPEGHRAIGPTLIAYQFFGHPRLQLMRSPRPNGDHHG